MNKQAQSGFERLIIVIVILSVMLIGALGFVFWQNSMQTKKDDTKISNSSKTDTTDKKSTIGDASSVTGQSSAEPTTVFSSKYLTVDDWGVKFKVPANLGDDTITYSYSKSNINFSTKRVEALGGLCTDTDPLGTISRSATPDNSPVEKPQFIKQFGDYYYYYSGPQDVCSQSGTDIQAEDRVMIADMIMTVVEK